MNQFAEYINHGWKLCRIQPGQKGPRSPGWNSRGNDIRDASELKAAGLLHAYSGTCALDIDDLVVSEKYLRENFSLELTDLLAASDAVQIVSGNPNHAKLLFALADPIPSKTFAGGAFELRCGTATGRSAQDVLPPSLHPSGTVYKWVGDWKHLPALPDALKALWLAGITTEKASNDITEKANSNLLELAGLVSKRSSDCGYDEWIKVGMALHHETGGSDAGFSLWDEWSASSDKYPGIAKLRSHWQSFGNSQTPITIDSLRKNEVASADEFEVVGAEIDFLAPEKPKQQFRFMDLDELFARPAPDWLIPGVLPEHGIGSFWGQPGSGKTFLAIDVALSVALGQSWRGSSVKQGGILYIAAEDDSGVQARLYAGLASRGARWAAIKVLAAAPTFTAPEQSKALLEAITAEGPQAITFVDTLAAVSTGSDENSGKDMGQLIAICQKIHKVTGGLVILIHHEGKTSGKGLRGWSGLHGAFDVEWEVSEEEHMREMRISKMKNAPAGKAYSFQLIPVGDSCIVEWV